MASFPQVPLQEELICIQRRLCAPQNVHKLNRFDGVGIQSFKLGVMGVALLAEIFQHGGVGFLILKLSGTG